MSLPLSCLQDGGQLKTAPLDALSGQRHLPFPSTGGFGLPTRLSNSGIFAIVRIHCYPENVPLVLLLLVVPIIAIALMPLLLFQR